ncbi:hypothetical protein Ancab_026757 [Ancistrocladus abbreviatus]
MITSKACFSKKHSQWPPKNFRLLPGLRVNAALTLPWMSETSLVSYYTNWMKTEHWVKCGQDKTCFLNYAFANELLAMAFSLVVVLVKDVLLSPISSHCMVYPM